MLTSAAILGESEGPVKIRLPRGGDAVYTTLDQKKTQMSQLAEQSLIREEECVLRPGISQNEMLAIPCPR